MLIFCAKVACHFYKKDKREETKIQIYAPSLTLTILCGRIPAQGIQSLPTTRILLKYHPEEKKICKLSCLLLQTPGSTKTLTRKLLNFILCIL